MLRLALFGFILVSSGMVNANNSDKQFTIKGAGAVSCQQYIDAVVQNEQRLVSFVGWLEGYLSFYNESTANTVDIAPWQSAELLSKALFTHCKKQANLPYFTAVKYMIAALKEQRLKEGSELILVTSDGKKGYYYREIIRRTQVALNVSLGLEIPEDGNFDSVTAQALKQFQAKQGITQSGTPDQDTLQRLFAK